jgi:hypothetical protein
MRSGRSRLRPTPNDFPTALPHLMHRGETVKLLYPRTPVDPSGSPYIGVRVNYSLTETVTSGRSTATSILGRSADDSVAVLLTVLPN